MKRERLISCPECAAEHGRRLIACLGRVGLPRNAPRPDFELTRTDEDWFARWHDSGHSAQLTLAVAA